MEGTDPEQGETTKLHALLNAAEEERDEAEAGAASAAEKKKNTQYQPITDEAKLAALRLQGLTKKGESKVTKGDLRCRPPRVCSETYFDKKLPQFRLRTVDETARAEDVVMVWAFVTGRDNKLRENELRFEAKNYLEDQVLISDLKALGNSSGAMVAYLKRRFGTVREPKIEPGFSTLPTTTTTGAVTAYYPGSMGHSEDPAMPSSQVQQYQQPSGGMVIKMEDYAERAVPLPIKTAREYVKMFRDELLKQKKQKPKSKEDAEEKKLTEEEEKMCKLRALHKAAWEGQAKAAYDLATQINDFNARLKFNYTPLHQAVLGSVGVKRRTNVLTAERLIDHGAEVDAQDSFERTPLHHASRRGDLQMIDLLLSKGANCNAVADNGSTPLHCAAESGGLAAVEKLLAAGAIEIPELEKQTSLDRPTRQGSLEEAEQGALIRGASSVSAAEDARKIIDCGTALHWAARAGQDEVVDRLLKAGFDANAQDWHESTPLHAAAREYKDEFPDRLKVGDYRSEMTPKRKNLGLPPLQNLAEVKGDHYFAVIRYLMGKSADREAKDADGRTPLHVAASCGNLKCVKKLLSGKTSDKATYSQKDALGYNPLMLTLIKREPESVLSTYAQSSVESNNEYWKEVDELMHETADDNRDNRGRTALHLAVLGGKTSVAAHLIKTGAVVDAKDINGATPLLLAARAQQRDCVELLLNNGADANSVDTFGCSSLSAAALAGDLAIVDLLLKNKAQVNLEKRSQNGQAGDEGRTALHDAAEAGNLQVAQFLLDRHANFNHATKYEKKTPLHIAARYGNTDVVQVLLEYGSKINAVDCKGRTALQIAQQHGLLDVVDLLNQEMLRVHGSTAAGEVPGEANQLPLVAAQHSQCEDPEDAVYNDWRKRFDLLNEFVDVHKRVPAPDEWFKGYQLGTWVELQKEKIRWDEMPEKELEAIGSVGKLLKDWGAGIPWMDWLQNVKAYVAENDKLPSAVAPKEPHDKRQLSASPTLDIDKKLLDLGWWCKFQQCRKAGKKDGKEKPSLDKGQIQELEALRQWRWESPGNRERQRIRLCLRLHFFCRKHKRLPYPDEHYLGVPLGKWCQLIRNLKVRGEISEKRRADIERYVLNKDKEELFKGSVRALWDKYRPSKEDYLECLDTFIKTHNSIPSRRDVGSNSINIGAWLNYQRQKWKTGNLAADIKERIDEIFKRNSFQYSWPIDRNSAGKDGDVAMEEARAVAVAEVEGDEKKQGGDLAGRITDADGRIMAAAASPSGQKDLSSPVEILKAAKEIPLEKRNILEALFLKASQGTELKSVEVLQLLEEWESDSNKLAPGARVPFKPEGGRTFFLDRNSRFRQDGYKWNKESRSTLKVNGENKLQCCYANTTDGTLHRRVYWELERPTSGRPALVFIHYISKQSVSLKRSASEAQMVDPKDVANNSKMAAKLNALADVAANDRKSLRIRDTSIDFTTPNAISDDILHNSVVKRRRLAASLRMAEAGQISSPVASPRKAYAPTSPAYSNDDDDDDGAAPLEDVAATSDFYELAEIETERAIGERRRIRDLLKELPIPRIEKKIPADGNSQFAAIADQVYGDYTKYPLIQDLVVKQLREHPEKYKEAMELAYAKQRNLDHLSLSSEELCDFIIRGICVKETLDVAADALETTIFVASDGGDWSQYIGSIGRPKRDQIFITHYGKIFYNSTAEEREKDEEKDIIKAAAPMPQSPIKMTSGLADNPDLEEKGLPSTTALPSKVLDMVASASLDNVFAMSAALKALFDHGIGGPAMQWAAIQVIGKKLKDEEKKILFQSVQGYIAEGKLKEAEEWVKGMKEALE